MKILITERPGYNSYITALINSYKNLGSTIVCGNSNFFYSNFVPDILHIHWPDSLYKWYIMSYKDMNKQFEIVKEKLNWYKSQGTKILHTIHDIHPHNVHNDIDFKFYNLVIEYSDILIHHGENSIKIINERYPISASKLNIVCKHGDFLLDYKFIPQTEARKILQIPENKFVILNFGNQQRYKGTENIEKIFNTINMSEKFLLTAGNYSYAGYSKVGRGFQMLSNFYKQKRNYKSKKYLLKTVELEMIPIIFNSADIVLLGHKKGLNSGVLNMAATFNKPTVFPRIGCFEEQMSSWEHKAYTVNNIEAAREHVIYYYNLKLNDNFKFDNKKWLSDNSWDLHVSKIFDGLKII